ncbi:MAG TPA: TldD/PmbA family protein [Candidatus Limnocylindrales bacterium]
MSGRPGERRDAAEARSPGERRDAAGWLDVAERAIEFARAAGADQAEALVMAGDSALTRFANSEIHQNVAESSATVNLRVVLGKRIAVVSTGRTDDASLRRLAERGTQLAQFVEPFDEFESLPAPTPIPGISGAYAAATAEATPELRAEAARNVIAEADEAGVVSYGSFTTGVEWTAVANTLGVRAAEARSRAHLLTVAMGPDDGTGYAEAASVDVGAIDPRALGREAASTARASGHPIELPPGDYPVVLGEYAVVDVLDYLGDLGFSALAVQQGRSFYEPGKRVGSELVTVWDDATDPAGAPAAFDYEGVGKQRVPLLEAGVCREIVFDAQTAAAAGRTSTGHALPAPNVWGPMPLNQVISAGTATREDLLGGLDRGLLVTRFWYTNPVHQKLVVMTGMTRDGTFLVEGGRIVGPVRNLRFTQSYLDAIAAVSAVGRDRKALVGMLGTCVVPALRVDSFTFTGVSEG